MNVQRIAELLARSESDLCELNATLDRDALEREKVMREPIPNMTDRRESWSPNC